MRASELKSLPMIERLIGFDTTSRLSNLELIEWVRAYLKGYGIESRLTFDDSGAKANLFATIGDASRPGIILSGHTDVVPVDGQPWDTAPFELTERDGRLYGRGTCDMKSFLAVVLAMVPDFVKRDLRTPIHLAFSYDEEVGCLGVRRLIADLVQNGLKPLACIVGEPSDMQVITSHKGKASFRGHVRGLECHSSLAPQGVNAVEAAAECVAFLKALMRQRRREGPFDASFDPPYTTIHTGVIRGGTALNIVPLDCSFDFEFRYIPEDDPDELFREVQSFVREHIEPEMHAVDPATGFTFDEISGFPGLDTAEDAEVTTLVKALAEANGSSKVAYGTEAGLFQTAGIPTIICGPGNIEQAHKPNEFVEVSQVALCEGFMRRLLERAAA